MLNDEDAPEEEGDNVYYLGLLFTLLSLMFSRHATAPLNPVPMRKGRGNSPTLIMRYIDEQDMPVMASTSPRRSNLSNAGVAMADVVIRTSKCLVVCLHTDAFGSPHIL